MADIFSTRARCFVLMIVLVVCSSVTVAPTICVAQSWNTRYEEIHQMYYNQGRQKEAIQALEDQIEAAGNDYSNAVLTRILDMLKEYFAIAGDTARFEKMIFSMLEPNRIDRIVDHFKNTKMYSAAKNAKKEWLKPVAASISVDVEELDIGESTGFRVSVTNQKKKAVSSSSVSVKITPEDYARIEGSEIVALQPGKVTITAADPDGNVLAQREVTVREGLGVTITPDYKELNIGEAEDFVIQSNKPFDKFPVKTVLEPKGLVTGSEFPAEPNADKKRIRITAQKPGTTLLKATDDAGTGLAQATIYVPPIPPSKLYPIVGTAVTVGLGVYSFIVRIGANDKFDEHEVCVTALAPDADPAQCNSLYDDYESKLKLSNIGFVVTGVAAAGTGYLWYKYFQDKKEYEKQLEKGTRAIGLKLDPVRGRVEIGYRF